MQPCSRHQTEILLRRHSCRLGFDYQLSNVNVQYVPFMNHAPHYPLLHLVLLIRYLFCRSRPTVAQLGSNRNYFFLSFPLAFRFDSKKMKNWTSTRFSKKKKKKNRMETGYSGATNTTTTASGKHWGKIWRRRRRRGGGKVEADAASDLISDKTDRPSLCQRYDLIWLWNFFFYSCFPLFRAVVVCPCASTAAAVEWIINIDVARWRWRRQRQWCGVVPGGGPNRRLWLI